MAIYVNPNTVPWLKEFYERQAREAEERKIRIELDRTFNILKNYGNVKQK